MASEAVEKKESGKTGHGKKAGLRLQVVKLLGNPALTWDDITQIVKCSRSTVARIAKEVSELTGGEEEEIKAYRRSLAKRMPVEDRAERLVALAKQDEQKKVSLEALRRIDHLQGIITPVELRDRDAHRPDPAPLFMLPPGTRMVMTRVQVETPTDTLSNVEQPKAIEATVVSSEEEDDRP
jgi:AraC-like DNA-binding protein